MTDRTDPRLELVIEDDDAPPPTSTQQLWIRDAVRTELGTQMKPILDAWDKRSADMLDVLREAADTKQQVRSASMTIKLAAWAGVFVLLLTGGAFWHVLERERADRRLFREQEQLRRLDAAQLIIDAGRLDVRHVEALLREGCGVKPSN